MDRKCFLGQAAHLLDSHNFFAEPVLSFAHHSETAAAENLDLTIVISVEVWGAALAWIGAQCALQHDAHRDIMFTCT